MPPRTLLTTTSRSAARRPLRRHATRMLGGARRPREPDYLALYIRAWTELLRLQKYTQPLHDADKRQAELEAWHREVDAALAKVYGPPTEPRSAPPRHFLPSEILQIIKAEKAVARAAGVIALLRAKLAQNR